MFKIITDIIAVNPFAFVVVILQIGAFIYSLFTGDYKPGVLMLIYGAGNAIIFWWR